MTKRENPRRREREFNKFKEKNNRGIVKGEERKNFKKRDKGNCTSKRN